MGVVFFVGDETTEQAIGARLDNGKMRLYAMRRNNPLDMEYLGGHRIDDAPTYNNSEGKVNPVYTVDENGRNRMIEEPLTSDYVKSIVFNLKLPNRLVGVTDRIYQRQNKSTYDYVFVPEICEDGCEEYFMFGRLGRLGVRQFDGSILGYDEQEGVMTSMRTLRITENLRGYHGMEVKSLGTAAAAVHGLALKNGQCDDAACPYQTIARGVLGLIVEVTQNGGTTWTPLTNTALTADFVTPATAVVPALLWATDDTLVVGASTTYNATGTDGSFAYSVSGGALTLAAKVNSAGAATTSLGVNVILKAFNKLYAFGTGGEGWYSCDNGLKWVKMTTGITQNIYDASYDAKKRIMYLAADNGEAWTFDGNTFTNISTRIGAGIIDLLRVAVTGEDAVAFGAADGKLYENFEFSKGDAFEISHDFGSAIGALVPSDSVYRFMAASADDIFKRDAFTKMDWKALYDAVGNFTRGVAGKPLLEEGTNFFVFSTLSGEIISVQSCGLCVGSGC